MRKLDVCIDILWRCFIGLIVCLKAGAAHSHTSSLQTQLDEAAPGSVVHVSTGTYFGGFTIRKPLTLVGDGEATVLDGRGHGTILTISAPDVRVSNLRLQNSGQVLGDEDAGIKAENSARLSVSHVQIKDTLFGIEVLASPDSTVEGSTIRGWNLDLGRRGDGLKIWYSPHTQVLGNHVDQSRDMLFWYSDGTVIKNNTIESSRYGIHYMYSHGSIAEANELTHNSVGIYDMYSNNVIIQENKIIENRGPSGFAVAVKESDNFRVFDNLIFGNRVGLNIDNAPITVTPNLEDGAYFKGNRIVRNDIGIAFIGIGQGTLFKANDLIDNWQQVSTKGSGISRAHWDENYWNDYRGIDPTHSGFGRTPYNTSNLADELDDLFESFKVFKFGPATVALQFAEQAIPWLKPDAQAVDPHPAMQPHTLARMPVVSLMDCSLFVALSLALFIAAGIARKAFAHD